MVLPLPAYDYSGDLGAPPASGASPRRSRSAPELGPESAQPAPLDSRRCGSGPPTRFPIAAAAAYTAPVAGIEGIRGVLDRRVDVRLAYVFGSVARGRAGPRSDVDVAVLFDGESAPKVLDQLTEDLEDAAGRRVDLIDLAAAPPLLAHQVVSTGTCIVCRSPRERAAFETRTVLRYLDTAHLRKIQHGYLAKRAQARHDGRA